jgi:hypothetical protein
VPERRLTGSHDGLPVGHRRLVGHRREGPHRRLDRGCVGEVDLEALAADAVLQLVGRTLGDHATAVDDRDEVGEPVGLVEVLAWSAGRSSY